MNIKQNNILVRNKKITLKIFLLIIFFLSVHPFIFSQVNDSTIINDSNAGFIEYEYHPEYKGGVEGLMKLISENIHYPESAIKDSVEGKVFVSFIIEKTGETTHHKILKGVRDDLVRKH